MSSYVETSLSLWFSLTCILCTWNFFPPGYHFGHCSTWNTPWDTCSRNAPSQRYFTASPSPIGCIVCLCSHVVNASKSVTVLSEQQHVVYCMCSRKSFARGKIFINFHHLLICWKNFTVSMVYTVVVSHCFSYATCILFCASRAFDLSGQRSSAAIAEAGLQTESESVEMTS